LTQINGQSFPDHVIALTWDDGPDTGSLPLAEYLHRRGVSATFFVVGEWVRGVSSDPGEGTGVYETGYEHLPILEKLVHLGHRLGNHTRNHVLLTEVDPQTVDRQVRENQERLAPFLTNDLRLLRVPGGAWSLAAANAVGADPALAGVIGPIRWDIDRKDWEGSLHCQSDRPSEECESAPVPGGTRVKPAVIARRYLESIEEAKHGIVLLHDRVGHVGSTYALDVARALVPELEARGYVFAPPVLSFSPLGARPQTQRPESGPRRESLIVAAAVPWSRGLIYGDVRYGDLNGDGRADACGRAQDGVVCALALPKGRGFAAGTIWLAGGTTADRIQLVDVNGDGRADLCTDSPEGYACGLAP
jgi:peptidoglycan/xylan/chitin deacetylase (PgdA/CDA1 family)